MGFDILTHRQSNQLLEIVHSLVFVKDIRAFKKAASSLKDLLECEFIMFWLPGSNSQEMSSVVDLNVNYPQKWVDIYRKNEFWRTDPVVLASKETQGVQRWSDVYNRTSPAKKILDLAHKYGLKDGWSCLNKGGIALPWTITSLGGEYKNGTVNAQIIAGILERISPYFHMAITSIRTKNTAKNIQKLTNREHEVLKWLSKGKTSWEISIILGVAEVTVNFHVKNIKTKLNTVSRSQAIAVAAAMGDVLK